MATRRLSLILQLKDHRAIVQAMKGMADQSQAIAAQTARQRQEVDALDTSYRRLQSTISTTASAAARLGGVPGNGGAGGNNFAIAPNVPSSGGGGGNSGGSGGGSLAYASGPYQRMQKLQEQIKRYMSQGGTTEEGKDLRLAWERNQEQIKKLESPGKSRMQLLGEALMTSRFGAGGLQPLVGRSMSALGIGGAAGGPVAMVATAAIAATQALYRMTEASAAATREFRQNQAIGGGTGLQTARLMGLGISGEASRGLLDRITSDGAALGVAAKLGVTATPGPYGTMNSASATLKILEGLRRESGEQQHRDMRILGLEGFAGLMKISNGTFDLLKRDARTTSRIMDSGQQARAAEFDVSQQRLGQSATNLMTSLSGPLMGDITYFFNNLASDINNVADWFSKNKGLVDNLWHIGRGGMFSLIDLFYPGRNRGNAGDMSGMESGDEDEATKENTEALRRLNHTFQQSERANRVYPAALKGEGFHKTLAANALPRGNI